MLEEVAVNGASCLAEQEELSRIDTLKAEAAKLEQLRLENEAAKVSNPICSLVPLLLYFKEVIEAAIKKAREVELEQPVDGSSQQGKKGKKTKVWDTIDCFGCGQSFTTAKYARHAVTCFSKV